MTDPGESKKALEKILALPQFRDQAQQGWTWKPAEIVPIPPDGEPIQLRNLSATIISADRARWLDEKGEEMIALPADGNSVRLLGITFTRDDLEALQCVARAQIELEKKRGVNQR